MYCLYGFVSRMYWSLTKEEDLIYRCCLLLDGFLLLKLLPVLWNWGWNWFQLSVCGQPTLPLQQAGFARVGSSKCKYVLLKFLAWLPDVHSPLLKYLQLNLWILFVLCSGKVLKRLILKFGFGLAFPVLPGGLEEMVLRARDADGRPVLIQLLLTPGLRFGVCWLLLTEQRWEPAQAKQINCVSQSLAYAKPSPTFAVCGFVL